MVRSESLTILFLWGFKILNPYAIHESIIDKNRPLFLSSNILILPHFYYFATNKTHQQTK